MIPGNKFHTLYRRRLNHLKKPENTIKNQRQLIESNIYAKRNPHNKPKKCDRIESRYTLSKLIKRQVEYPNH